MPAQKKLIVGGLLGLIGFFVTGVVFGLAGGRGFTVAGGSTLFNYFPMGVGAMGAWLHRLLAARALR